MEYQYIVFLPLLQLASKIYQQDGAPPHGGSHVHRFWIKHFQKGALGEMVQHRGHHDRRISPRLTSFYRGYVKGKVFWTPVPDITNLKARITDAFAIVTEDMLENTWREIDYRLDVLRATRRAHVEVY